MNQIKGAGKKDKAQKQLRDIMYCAYCPKLCRFSCPVSEATSSETLTPWGKQSILFEVERNIIPLSEDYSSVFYACLECHRCMTFCEHNIDVPLSLRIGRQKAFEARAVPGSILRMHKQYSERENLAKNVLERKFPLMKPGGLQKLCLMPGCVTALRDLKSVESAVKIIRELAGEEFGIQSRLCCGLPLLHAGDVEGFKVAAKCMAEALKEIKTIIVMDPGCAYTMTKHYNDHGIQLDTKVLTFVEFAVSYINHFRKKIRIPQPAYYHDPCHLGRDLGIFSEPRDILMKITFGGIRDSFQKREQSLCCGGGGGVPESMPETAEIISLNLANLFRKAGAASVVTACPTCKSMILKSSSSMEVFDIADLLAKTL